MVPQKNRIQFNMLVLLEVCIKRFNQPRFVHQYGIVYWNSGIFKRGLIKIPGFDEKKFDEDLGIKKDYGQSGPVKTKMG